MARIDGSNCSNCKSSQRRRHSGFTLYFIYFVVVLICSSSCFGFWFLLPRGVGYRKLFKRNWGARREVLHTTVGGLWPCRLGFISPILPKTLGIDDSAQNSSKSYLHKKNLCMERCDLSSYQVWSVWFEQEIRGDWSLMYGYMFVKLICSRSTLPTRDYILCRPAS